MILKVDLPTVVEGPFLSAMTDAKPVVAKMTFKKYGYILNIFYPNFSKPITWDLFFPACQQNKQLSFILY